MHKSASPQKEVLDAPPQAAGRARDARAASALRGGRRPARGTGLCSLRRRSPPPRRIILRGTTGRGEG